MRVGFLVNPVAGMGGRVGLKGTDGKASEAAERGAEPEAPVRAREMAVHLDRLLRARGREDLEFLTCAPPMGAGLRGDQDPPPHGDHAAGGETTAEDVPAAAASRRGAAERRRGRRTPSRKRKRRRGH